MTNTNIIPSLVNESTPVDEQINLINTFLGEDPKFKQLDSVNRSSVITGIQKELKKIDKNYLLTEKGVVDYKTWYLTERVPRFLENMLNGQNANQRMNSDRELKSGVRSHLDFATRQEGPNAR